MSCASARCASCWSRSVRSRRSRAIWASTREALRRWVRQAEADAGSRQDRLATAEREELARLRGEVKQLRKANEILKAASAFFAGELDPTRSR